MNDLTPFLNDWNYNSDDITVRRIAGLDGRAKIQFRLDLGILQMEISGRPDGQKPHGCDSLLEYQEKRRHRLEKRGEELSLSPEECNELRQESMQFYYRYLSLFHLGDYAGVIRDTQRNIRAFDLIRDFSEEESDRASLEQFRPYVLMMNTRARACLLLEDKEYELALEQIERGVERIEEFLREAGREELIEQCREIAFLQDWRERIQSNSPVGKLREKLRLAVEAEDYERAAQIRDEIQEKAL